MSNNTKSIPKLTKAQYTALEPFQNHFATAKGNYLRGLYSRDVIVLKGIYEALGYRLENESCGSCVLTMVKILGEIFSKNKPPRSRNQNNDNNNEQES